MEAASWIKEAVRYHDKNIYITLENYAEVRISVEAIVQTLVQSTDTKIDDAIASVILGAL